MTKENTHELMLDWGNQEKRFSEYRMHGEKDSLSFLPNFNKINIFVGANNSGKSRMMRGLLHSSNLSGLRNFEVNILRYRKYVEAINSINSAIDQVNSEFETFDPIKPLFQFKLMIDNFQKLERNKEFLKMEFPPQPRYVKLRSKIDAINGWDWEIEKSDLIQNLRDQRIFIPTLRTAHSLYENGSKKYSRDIFENSVRTHHEELKEANLFTGLSLYEEILSARNSNKDTRNKFEAFERFLSINFFGGKTIDIVASFDLQKNQSGETKDQVITVHVEGETETRKLHELGDGIQALIILMYKIFMAEDGTFIFIDEPELNLHPGMQRLFLEQIATNKELTDKNLTYVLSTHSNHFLDLTLNNEDVSIYSFKAIEGAEPKKFEIRNGFHGDVDVLQCLGVNNSSVFLANCSIWVEGISDRNILKAFLVAYFNQKDLENENKLKYRYPKEDIDFAFFEYAGSNYEHYEFDQIEDELKDKINAFALNNRIFFFSDLDEKKDKKHEKLSNLLFGKNCNYMNTNPYREIENLLPNTVWKKVLPEFRRAKITSEQLEVHLNKKLLDHDADKYKSDYIGKFLQDLELDAVCTKLFDLRNETPTCFHDKRKLSEEILKKTQKGEITWSDFEENKTIVKISEAMYKFITTSKS